MYKNRTFDEKLQKFVKSKKITYKSNKYKNRKRLQKLKKMKFRKNHKIEKSQLNFRAQNQA